MKSKEEIKEMAIAFAEIPRNINCHEQGIYQAGIRLGYIEGYNAAASQSASQPVGDSDYEEVLSDHRALVKELDVLLNGNKAAKQPSLCDIVTQVRDIKLASLQQPQPVGELWEKVPVSENTPEGIYFVHAPGWQEMCKASFENGKWIDRDFDINGWYEQDITAHVVSYLRPVASQVGYIEGEMVGLCGYCNDPECTSDHK